MASTIFVEVGYYLSQGVVTCFMADAIAELLRFGNYYHPDLRKFQDIRCIFFFIYTFVNVVVTISAPALLRDCNSNHSIKIKR